jgi:N-acetyl-gamma-glutamyl-phosphate reductase
MVAAALELAYAAAPFVRLTGGALPEIKHVTHTNFCDIGWKLDAGSRRLVLIACLDNLVKGAAGQALQNLNVAFGLDETTGLT